MLYLYAGAALLQLVAIILAIRAARSSGSAGAWSAFAASMLLASAPVVRGLVAEAGVPMPSVVSLVVTGCAVAAALLASVSLFLIGSAAAATRRSVLTASTQLARRQAAEAASPIPQASIDLERRLITVNRAFCEAVGWPESELLGKAPPHPFWPTDDAPAAAEALHNIVQSRGRRSQQVVMVRRSGERIDVVLHSAPMTDASGSTIGWQIGLTEAPRPVAAPEPAAPAPAAEPVAEPARLVAGHAAALFLQASGLDETIPQLLHTLCRSLDASRAFAVIDRSGGVVDAYEWQAPGIAPRAARGADDPAVVAEDLRGDVVDDRPLRSHVRDLHGARRSALEAHGVRSVLVIPVALGAGQRAYLGLDECKNERVWTDDEVSTVLGVASMLAVAVARYARESAVARSETRYHGVFAASSAATLVIDPRSGALLDANAAAFELYGLDEAGLRERTLWQVYVDADQARSDMDGEPHDIPNRLHQRADGATFPAQLRYSYFEEGGSTVCALTVIDLAARAKLERALEDSRRRLARLLQTLPVGVCVLRGDEQRLANDAVWRMFGYDAPPPSGSALVLDQIAPASRHAVRSLIGRAVAGEDGFLTCDAWAVRQDGSTFPVRVDAAPMLLPDGPAAIAYLTDVTETVGAEHALRRRLSMEEMVTAVAGRLVNVKLDSMVAEINRSLQAIGTFLAVDHAFLALLTDDRSSVGHVFEWNGPAMTPGATELAALSVEHHPWAWSKLARSEMLRVPRVSALPAEAAAEHALWDAHGVRSALMLPLVANGSLVGMFGFSAVAAELQWPQEDVQLLALVGQSLLTAFARMNVEDALRQDLAMMSAMVNATTDLVAMVDRDGRIVATSDTLPRMLARRAEDLIGRDLFDMMPLQVRDIRRQRFTTVLSTGSFVRWQDQSPGKQWLNSLFPVLRDDGTVERVAVYCTDVTEQLVGDEGSGLTTMQLRTSLENVERRSEDKAILIEAGATLQACLTSEELCYVVGMYAPRMFPGSSGALYMLNSSRTSADAFAAWGDSTMNAAFAPETCWSLRRGRVHLVGAGTSDIPCRHIVGTSSLTHMCVPLMALGEAIGVLVIQFTGPAGRSDHRSLEYEASIAMTFGERAALAVSSINLQRSLRDQAIRDPLTGLFNRRYMEETLEREMKRAAREGLPLSICMVDIDRFKLFNDVHGHDAGDTALMEIGRILLEGFRVEDIACRYGGEEFTLVLPGARLLEACARVEAVRQRIGAHPFVHLGQRLGSLSISVGVACYPEHGETWQEVVRAADAALYRAKREGRDRTTPAEMFDRAVSRPRIAERRADPGT